MLTTEQTYLPSERLIHIGVDFLSEYELLALICRTGSQKQDVLTCAKQTLEIVGGLQGLGTVTLQQLCRVEGIGQSKATAILAAIELGKRVYQHKNPMMNYAITSPLDCVNCFCAQLKYQQQESLIAICLNTKNVVLAYREIYRGGLNSVPIHAREIFCHAIKQSAAAIILVHNHPSGDPFPSEADISTTKILMQAGEIMGIPILDHIIVGNDDFYSLKEAGII